MYYNNLYIRDGRGGFFLPFITGALVGGAAVGVTRPRPIVNSPYPYYQPYYRSIPYYY